MRGVGLWVLVFGVCLLILIFYYLTLLNVYLFAKRGRNLYYREFYECGFKAIPDIRLNLDLQFAVLCFIFLIYDIEVVLLVPLFINLHSLPLLSYILIWIILGVLLLSYYYEWEKYMLQWGLN